MAKVAQNYVMVDDIAKQMLGKNAIKVTDSSSLLDFGNVVVSSQQNVDLFYKAAIDRVARVEIGTRMYKAKNRRLRRDSIEWGMFIEKLRVKTKERYKENPALAADSMQHSPFDVEKSSELVAQIFGKDLPTWSIEDVLPGQTQLFTSFTSIDEFNKLISAIRIEIQNEIETAMEGLDSLCIGTLIAYVYKKGKTTQKINVLKEYNTQFGTSLTVEQARHDADYLRYRVQRMQNMKEFLTKRTELFNAVADYANHVDSDDLIIEVLTEAASDIKTYMMSDTYHTEFVELPGYDEIACWQGMGNDNSYTSHAKIDVKHDEIGEDEVVVNNVFAVMRSDEAAGTMFQIQRSWAHYNDRDDVTPFGIQVVRSYRCDPYENCVIFYDDANEV